MIETAATRAECPRCGFTLEVESLECPACGIVFARYETAQQAGPPEPSPGGSVVGPGAAWGMSGAVPPGGVAELMRPPRELIWVANLSLVGGALNLLLAAALVVLVGNEPEVLRAAGLNVFSGCVSLWLGIATKRLRPAARVVLLISAFFSLLAIPVGTILSPLLLAYLFHRGTKVLFSGKQPHELTPSDVEHLLDVRSSAAGIWFVRLVKFFLFLALLGILALLGLGLMSGPLEHSRAMSDLYEIDFEVRDYSLARDTFPPTQDIDDLASLLRAPMPVADPWGNAYRYERVGSDFRVASAGPDGEWEHRRLSGYEEGAPAGDDIVLAAGEFLTQ